MPDTASARPAALRWSATLRQRLLRADEGTPAGIMSAAMRRAEVEAAERMFALLLGAVRQRPADVGVDTLLLKPVGDRCNLACPYCYEDARRTAVDSGRVDLAAACRVLDNVLPFAGRPFHIFLHGGEPLLCGLAYVADLVAHVRAHHDGDVHWGVQTNGVLIDAEWARFFKANGFSVGVSLDGPPDVHDRQRPGKRGAPSHAAVVAGVQRLAAEDVAFGVTTVVTAAHAARPDAAAELFDHFTGLGITRFDVHPAYAPIDASAAWNLSPEAYAGFMLDLFDVWLKRADGRVRIRTFEEYFRVMAGLDADTCHRSGRCTSIIGADPNGQATACTRPFDARYTFGDLSKTPAPEVLASAACRSFATDEAQGRLNADCAYMPFCGGGCPHERLAPDGAQSVSGRHVYCTCCDGATGGVPALISGMMERMNAL